MNAWTNRSPPSADSAPTVMRGAQMEWTESPLPGVWRKRFFHSGPAEAGKVSSLVRYDAGCRFREHDHPDGEEILVLDGVFSDHRGDFGAGHYLLSAEGFRHAPFSDQGCLIFVRLRQYPGLGRDSLLFDSELGDWRSRGFPGAEQQFLYRSDDYPQSMWLTRLKPGTRAPTVELPHGEEMVVLQGDLHDEFGSYGPLDYLRFPPGSRHTPFTQGGCLLYVASDASAPNGYY